MDQIMIQYNYRTMTTDAVTPGPRRGVEGQPGHRRHEDAGGRRQFQGSDRVAEVQGVRRQGLQEASSGDQDGLLRPAGSRRRQRDDQPRHAPREHRAPAATTPSRCASKSCSRSTARRPRTSTATAAVSTASRPPAEWPWPISCATCGTTRSTASASAPRELYQALPPEARRSRQRRPRGRPGRLSSRTAGRGAPAPSRSPDGLRHCLRWRQTKFGKPQGTMLHHGTHDATSSFSVGLRKRSVCGSVRMAEQSGVSSSRDSQDWPHRDGIGRGAQLGKVVPAVLWPGTTLRKKRSRREPGLAEGEAKGL